MKATLAKKLIGELMHWDDDRATLEFQWLDLMVGYKFDHYQQFGPGHRFYVHLIRWLTQFEISDREIAYDFLRKNLIYISSDEMHHLVSLTWPQIEKVMRSTIAARLQMPIFKVAADKSARRRLQILRTRTLYVGASDGARIDVFRRYNEGLVSNEQVVPMLEISKNKKDQLVSKLQKRLDEMESNDEASFACICLIDDFTASGSTSIRRSEDGKWDGKVHRFMQEMLPTENGRFLAEDVLVVVHHYLASSFAKDKITTLLAEYRGAGSASFVPSFSYVLPESIVVTNQSDPHLAALVQRRYDPGIETSHTGAHIALGYKQCGLPLVLAHNTPNNSVATLWALSDPMHPKHVPENYMSPLFPRRQRHSDSRS